MGFVCFQIGRPPLQYHPTSGNGADAMPFQATCPNCLKILEVPESLLGKQVRCASCQQIFLIGQPRGSSAGAESAPKSVRTNDAGPQIQRAPRPPVMLRPSEELPSRRP